MWFSVSDIYTYQKNWGEKFNICGSKDFEALWNETRELGSLKKILSLYLPAYESLA